MAETTTKSAGRATGPRSLGGGSQLQTLIKSQVMQLLWTRKTKALAAIQLLPAIAAFVYVIFEDVDGLTMFGGIVENVTFPFLIPLAAIFYGGPAIVDEMEGRTLTYLTLRPIGKARLFLGKALAGILVALPMVLIPLLVLFLVCLSQSSDYGATLESLGQMAGAAALGTAAYTAVFAALGAAFASSLLASIIYFVIFEMVLAALPVVELLSIRYYLRVVAGFSAGDRLGLLDKMVLDEPIVLDTWLGIVITAIVIVAGLGIGATIFREKTYHV